MQDWLLFQDEDTFKIKLVYRGEEDEHIPHKFLNPHAPVNNYVPRVDKHESR